MYPNPFDRKHSTIRQVIDRLIRPDSVRNKNRKNTSPISWRKKTPTMAMTIPAKTVFDDLQGVTAMEVSTVGAIPSSGVILPVGDIEDVSGDEGSEMGRAKQEGVLTDA